MFYFIAVENIIQMELLSWWKYKLRMRTLQSICLPLNLSLIFEIQIALSCVKA